MTWWLWLLAGWLAGGVTGTVLAAVCAAAGAAERLEEVERLRYHRRYDECGRDARSPRAPWRQA